MIIQFNPSAAGSDSPLDTPSGTYDSLNWIHDPSVQRVMSQCAEPEENASKILPLELAYPEEPTLLSNYVEEVKAKRFKGTNSVAVFVREGMEASPHQRPAHPGSVHWHDPKFREGGVAAPSIESLPDAA